MKWHREQFAVVARNCRSDGKEFLLGVRREPRAKRAQPGPLSTGDSVEKAAAPKSPEVPKVEPNNVPPPATQIQIGATPRDTTQNQIATPIAFLSESASKISLDAALPATQDAKRENAPAKTQCAIAHGQKANSSGWAEANQASRVRRTFEVSSTSSQVKGSSPRQERKVMQSKGLFPKFWNRQLGAADAPDKAPSKEVSVNTSQVSANAPTRPQSDLLSYEDIYSAAGTSPDELLRDATRRQQALNSYETSQKRQLEQFEARKAEEDARIQREMERVNAHYAERIQQNQEQVAREKEALRNWQMAKQYESQRIAEVIELCGKQSASPSTDALSSVSPSNGDTAQARTASVRPSLANKASAGLIPAPIARARAFGFRQRPRLPSQLRKNSRQDKNPACCIRSPRSPRTNASGARWLVFP